MDSSNPSRKRSRLWSDEDFCVRVQKRCAELNRSQRDVLKAAGVAHDYLQTNPAHGRRVDRLARVAQELNWTLPDIMGLELSEQAKPRLLLIACKAACDAMRDKVTIRAEYLKAYAALVATFYNTVLEQQTQGHPVDDPAYLKAIIGVSYFHENMAAELADVE
jgi:hypothetical protein